MVPNANARHFLIKAKQRDLIAAAGGIERAAAVCDRSKSVVGRWFNGDNPEWIDLPALFALEEETGRFDLSEAIAALRGRSFADAAAAGHDTNACIMARHAEAMVQVGELAASAAMAFSDGRLTPAEASQIDRAASALERAISELRKATAGARGDGGISLVKGSASS